MSNKVLKQIRNTLAIGGLAAMVSGCVISQPTGNGGVQSLYVTPGMANTILGAMFGNQNRNSGQQNNSRGPIEPTRPLGKTKYSYPFLQYSGSGDIAKLDNFLNKRSVISLSESDVVYFGTSWNANNIDGDGFWTGTRTSTSFIACDKDNKIIYSDSEKLDDVKGYRVRWVGLDREVLQKAGNQVKVIFLVRDKKMRNNNQWDEHAVSDSYIVPIVP